MIKNYLLTTISALRQNPLYTALSVFGIALTFVFVSVLFLLVESGKGDYIPPKYAERTWQVQRIEIENGRTIGISKELYETWVSKMRTPEITVVTSNSQGETMILNDQNIIFNIVGVGDNYFDVWRHKFLSGRPINKQEIADAAPVVVLDRNTANLYFGKNEDAIGKNFELNGIQFRVVGIVENQPLLRLNNQMLANVWIPLESQHHYSYVILFTAKDKNSVAEMQAEFTRVLNETNMAEGSQYKIPERNKRTFDQQTSMFPSLSILIGCLILMLIPALNILSLNVSRSFERSEEIAVRKAFGAPIRTIFGQLLIENTLITLVGAVIGMLIALILINAIDKMMVDVSVFPMALSLHFDWKTILIVAVPCVLLFSFLSGSVPAYITAKRQIVNVLKGESL